MEAISSMGSSAVLGIALAVSIVAVSVCLVLINRFGRVHVDFHVVVKVEGRGDGQD